MVRPKSKTSIIYLLGMPGCGKSTLGRLLATSMNCDFIDLDTYIEKKAGLTIPQIFSKLGEEKFRKLEQEAIVASTTWKNTIVACGGGAPCFYNNMQTINDAGETIYINTSPEEIHKRISNKGQENRPLLQDKKSNELLTELKQKKYDRSKFYSQAKKIIFSDNLSVEQLKRYL